MRKPNFAVVLGLLAVCAGCHRGAPPNPPAAAQKEAAKAPPQPEEDPTVSEVAVGEKTSEKRLLRGFYESHGGWRWSGRVFAVSVDVPQPVADTFVELDFGIPGELMDQVKDVTIVGRVNGKQVLTQKYDKKGRYFLTARIPQPLLAKTPVEVEFELDSGFKDPANGRELGLNVVGVSLKQYEQSVLGREEEAKLSRNAFLKMLQARRLTMPVEKQTEFMKLFKDLEVWSHMWYHNVQIEKTPMDLWMMQQVITEQQPEFIVETGTAFGGSALYWAGVLHALGLEKSRVLTVDIDDFTKKASADFLWKKYVTFYKGSSTDPAITAQIAQLTKGRRTIVTLDSNHRMSHVLNELKIYSPLVNRGSYLIVEDTHLDGVPTDPGFGPGPAAATRKFLAEGGSRNFAVDLTREAYVMTFNPGGWLKRK